MKLPTGIQQEYYRPNTQLLDILMQYNINII